MKYCIFHLCTFLTMILVRLIFVAGVLTSLKAQRGFYTSMVLPQDVFQLPDLPFAYNALEPLIDTATLKVHHQGHHKAYCDKTNSVLKQWRDEDGDPEPLSQRSIVEILQRLPEVPEKWRTNLRNNGGGYLNHIFYWETMCPSPKENQPTGQLALDIDKAFGSIERFKGEFSGAGARLFGSGYVWLCEDEQGKLVITSTHNQDSPLTSGLYPLLVLDVWEHAYYLQHQNKRLDHIFAWWYVVCWDHVTQIRKFWQDHRKTISHEEL